MTLARKLHSFSMLQATGSRCATDHQQLEWPLMATVDCTHVEVSFQHVFVDHRGSACSHT
jgi:hypothetical protein